MCYIMPDIVGLLLSLTGPVRSVLRDSNHGALRPQPQPLNDVSIQADLCGVEPTTYESEDELMGMGRRKQLGRSKRGTPLYSKEDIREQYCINDKQLHGLEDVDDTGGLFGCLSTYNVGRNFESSCSSRAPGLLSVCVRRKVPSDENLQELCRRQPHDYAPLPRWPRYFPHDDPVYFRRRPKSLCNDPNSYTWFPEDEDAIRMERPRSVRPEEYEMCNSYPRRGMHYMSYSTEYLVGRHPPCPAHPHLPPPPPPPALPTAPHRPKHVSFARSHTLTSFDDAVIGGIGTGVAACSQERLIDGKKSVEVKEPAKVVVMEKVKRAQMKTQATQTEVCLGRKPLPPTYLSLSPRTIHRVRMVSQGAQTNGDKNNQRRLMKSYSEVGGKFGVAVGVHPALSNVETHEPLQRTQSEEPPRSPFMPTSPKEILIDFEPLERRGRKRILSKTLSEGENLESGQSSQDKSDGGTQSDSEPSAPVDEPLEKRSASSVYSEPQTPVKKLLSADSQDEEFHENLIYGSGLFHKHSPSMEDGELPNASTTDVKITPPAKVQSPFASSDSLNTKDHSDSIWNESQTTVLHAESDNNGAGTGVSCSDISSSLTPSAAIMSLTPTSRRKHLLMLQHQQRSSMDTEALDAEDLDMEQPPLSPRLRLEAPQTVPVVAVTTPLHDRRIDTKHRTASPFHEKKIEQSLSPSHRGRRKSPDSEIQQQAAALMNSNDMLARSDSGRTNTDMSETSTTTEDYATATENNSGTDTSSKQLARGDSAPPVGAVSAGGVQGTTSAAGSSFESGSSLYSLARGDTEEIPQAVSPPPILEEKERNSDGGGEERQSRDADSISGESSSSGSYSVDGSSGVEKQASDHSGRCSSAGEYESPIDHHEKSRSWTEEERSRVKKGFKLELSPREEQPLVHSTGTTPQQQRMVFPRKSPPSKEVDNAETPRRMKARSRSPVQPTGKRTPVQVAKEVVVTPGMVRSPAMHDGFRPEDWATPQRHTPEEKIVVSNGMVGGASSEESSGECPCGRQRRPRESPRRKSGGGRSPTTHTRGRRRSNSGDERRRCSLIAKSPSPVTHGEELQSSRTNNSRLCPHENARSPGESPSRRNKSKGVTSPEAARLKALSAESLRSVSPGSDSVFYSEHSSNTVTLTEQHSASLCHHCGRHVDASSPSAGGAGNGGGSGSTKRQEGGGDIVQPPAGFADSPKPHHRDRSGALAPRLYKKVDKRFRSEERRHHARIHAEAVRAKSEERGREERREKVRPLTRSTDASMEKLRCSPSSLGSDDDEWSGVYADAYNAYTWVYIGDTEELQVWQRPESREDDDTPSSRRDSIDSTHSEREFRRKYQAITHRMVHRKSSLEMYKRLASKSFVAQACTSLRERLEELLKLMLVVWCKQVRANSVVSGTPDESDKRVLVRRVSGEFGFRIHGSRPVVVSAIEPATPAESSGLEVGDIVISVNRVNVLDASHSEVVKLAHGGSDTLELEVARTSDIFTTGRTTKPILSGTLLRLSSSSAKMRPTWVPRYFVLKQDHCLYYYKTETETQPVGALHLADYSITHTPDSGCPHSFRVGKKGAISLHLAASSAEKAEQWISALTQATKPVMEPWLDERNLKMPPMRIPKPDCAGTLCTLAHHRGKAWRRRFCLLKDACLYFYSDINSDYASGMACLQGYRVQSSASGAKRFAFELIPPEPSLRHFYFYTDTEMDKKRWMAALEYSIDRWIKVG